MRLNGVIIARPHSRIPGQDHATTRLSMDSSSNELNGAIYTQGDLDINRLTQTFGSAAQDAAYNLGLIPVWPWRELY